MKLLTPVVGGGHYNNSVLTETTNYTSMFNIVSHVPAANSHNALETMLSREGSGSITYLFGRQSSWFEIWVDGFLAYNREANSSSKTTALTFVSTADGSSLREIPYKKSIEVKIGYQGSSPYGMDLTHVMTG